MIITYSILIILAIVLMLVLMAFCLWAILMGCVALFGDIIEKEIEKKKVRTWEYEENDWE